MQAVEKRERLIEKLGTDLDGRAGVSEAPRVRGTGMEGFWKRNSAHIPSTPALFQDRPTQDLALQTSAGRELTGDEG